MTGGLRAIKTVAYLSAKAITITPMQLSKSFMDPGVWVWKGMSLAANPANLATAEPQMVDSQCAQSGLKRSDQVDLPLLSRSVWQAHGKACTIINEPFPQLNRCRSGRW